MGPIAPLDRRAAQRDVPTSGKPCNAARGVSGPTGGRDIRPAGRVAHCLWWIGTTAQHAPNRRAGYPGEMGLYQRRLVLYIRLLRQVQTVLLSGCGLRVMVLFGVGFGAAPNLGEVLCIKRKIACNQLSRTHPTGSTLSGQSRDLLSGGLHSPLFVMGFVLP
jgi:hypothetical protein